MKIKVLSNTGEIWRYDALSVDVVGSFFVMRFADRFEYLSAFAVESIDVKVSE